MLLPLGKASVVPSAAWIMLGRVPGPVPAKFEDEARGAKELSRRAAPTWTSGPSFPVWVKTQTTDHLHGHKQGHTSQVAALDHIPTQRPPATENETPVAFVTSARSERNCGMFEPASGDQTTATGRSQ